MGKYTIYESYGIYIRPQNYKDSFDLKQDETCNLLLSQQVAEGNQSITPNHLRRLETTSIPFEKAKRRHVWKRYAHLPSQFKGSGFLLLTIHGHPELLGSIKPCCKPANPPFSGPHCVNVNSRVSAHLTPISGRHWCKRVKVTRRICLNKYVHYILDINIMYIHKCYVKLNLKTVRLYKI